MNFQREDRLLKKLLLCVCLYSVLFSGNALAQENRTTDFDRQTYIQSEIEKQKIRLNSSDVEERRDAVLRLGWIKTPDSSSTAVSALNDSSAIVRATATQAILSLPSVESVNYLLPLLSDKDELVRQEAAYALGKTQNQNAISKLLTLLNNKKEKHSVRSAVAVSLGLIGDTSVVPSLIQVLEEKKNVNSFLQSAVVHSLGQLRAKESVTLLIGLLENEKNDPNVRREAAWALGGLRDVSALAVLSKAMFSADPYLSYVARKSYNVIKLE